MKKLFAAVNGYGVPRDIFTDLGYHAYLVQVFNYLWEGYRKQSLTIMPVGGPTDLFAPYRRTEAGEITKWLQPRVRGLGLSNSWKIKPCVRELSALENMLAVKRMVGKSRMLYFCERSREQKMKALARKIFGAKAKVMGVEFDGSPLRYSKNRVALEREDLAYSLLALKDKRWRAQLKRAAVEKIRLLRRTPVSKRAKVVDEVSRRVKRQFFERYRKLKD